MNRGSVGIAGVVVVVVVIGLAVGSVNGQWLEPDCDDIVSTAGAQSGSLFGDRVAAVGDVTGDGVPDFAVAVPFYNTNRGRVSVHSGVDGSEVWGETTSITSTILGYSLAVAPDLNGDGVRDVVSGALVRDEHRGFVYVYSGADGDILHTFQGDPVGFNASIGYSVAANGDFNGDGVMDIAIGDAGNDDMGPNAGRVSVYSSANYSLITHVYPPIGQVARFGTACAYVGDTNGDGKDELVIGERLVSTETPGRLRVFGLGRLQFAEIRYTIEPVNLGCQLCGDPIGAGRDMDGDGIGDIVISETDPDFRARGFSGVDGTPIFTTTTEVIQTAQLIDDVDGDGLADVIAGDQGNDEGGEDAGKVFVYSGATETLLRTMTSTMAGTGFGTRLVAFDDLDQDGVSDILVGARSGIGHAYVMAGIATAAAGDVDGDGLVDINDLLLVLGAWGPCPGCPEDLNGDAAVDIDDLLTVLGAFAL